MLFNSINFILFFPVVFIVYYLIRVLMKTKKETIRELLFVCTGKEDCTLVQINGKFTKDDINKLVNQETGKKHGHR